MIRFACPVCHAALNVPDAAVGKKGPCPKCGQRLQIPALPRNRTILGISFPNESKDGSLPLVLPKEAASDIQSVQLPTLAPAPGRRSWLRLTSPTFLIGGLVLFFLPWVDIRCSAADSGKTLASQSGFQMIYGGYSLPAAWESQGMDGRQYVKEKFGVESCSFAPLLGVFFLLLIGATVGAFSASARPFALALAIASLLILFGHLFFGLPAQRDLTSFYRELGKDKNGFNGFAILIETHLTIWFWLALLFLLSAIGSLVAETTNWLRIRRARLWILDMPKRNASRSVLPHSSAEARATPATEPISVTLVPADEAQPYVWERITRLRSKTLILLGLLLLALVGLVAVAFRHKEETAADGTSAPASAEEMIQITLTDDERIAWRKVCNERKKMPIHILGCLAGDRGMRSFYGDESSSSDHWHFVYQRDAIIEKGYLQVEFTPWASGKNLGSCYRVSSYSTKYEDTEDFRTRTDRYEAEESRARNENEKIRKEIKGWGDDKSDRDYESRESARRREKHELLIRLGRESFEEGKFPSALKRAEALCPRNEVKAIAVVNVFEGDSPSILKWYWSDGEKVQSSDRPPNQQRQRSLSKFLESLMRHASGL